MEIINNDCNHLVETSNGCIIPSNLKILLNFEEVLDPDKFIQNNDGSITMQYGINQFSELYGSTILTVGRNVISTKDYELPAVSALIHKYSNESNYLRCNFNFSSNNLLSFMASICSCQHTIEDIQKGMVNFYTLYLENGKLIVKYFDGNIIRDILMSNNDNRYFFYSNDLDKDSYFKLPASSREEIFDVSNLSVSDIFDIIIFGYNDVDFSELINYISQKIKSNLKEAPRLSEQDFKIKGYTRIRRRETVQKIKDRRLSVY